MLGPQVWGPADTEPGPTMVRAANADAVHSRVKKFSMLSEVWGWREHGVRQDLGARAAVAGGSGRAGRPMGGGGDRGRARALRGEQGWGRGWAILTWHSG